MIQNQAVRAALACRRGIFSRRKGLLPQFAGRRSQGVSRGTDRPGLTAYNCEGARARAAAGGLSKQAEDMKLAIKVVPKKEGGYAASCPCLPGCVSYGKTKEEAAERLIESIRGYLAAMGNFVPSRVECEILQT